MNLLTTPMLYGLGAAVLAAGLFAGVQTVRLSSEKAAHATTKATHADVLRNLAELTAKAVQEKRAAEAQYSVDMAKAQAESDKRNRDAIANKDATIASLRSGALQLQDHWACLVPAAAGDQAPAFAGRSDDAADLRAEGAAAFVQDADSADGDIVWLQSALIATRKACGVAP